MAIDLGTGLPNIRNPLMNRTTNWPGISSLTEGQPAIPQALKDAFLDTFGSGNTMASTLPTNAAGAVDPDAMNKNIMDSLQKLTGLSSQQLGELMNDPEALAQLIMLLANKRKNDQQQQQAQQSATPQIGSNNGGQNYSGGQNNAGGQNVQSAANNAGVSNLPSSGANTAKTDPEANAKVDKSVGPTAGKGAEKWRKMAEEYVKAYGLPPDAVNHVLALIKTESNGNPKAVGDNGHSVGLFQLHDKGVGAGLSVAQRHDPHLQFQKMMPRIKKAYEAGKANGLTGGKLTSYIAKEAERPAAWTLPKYAANYNRIMSSGVA